MLFTLKFLKDLPIYRSVQPYKLHGYTEVDEEQQTNCVYEEVEDVAAEDIRESKRQCSFEREGFEYITAPTSCDLTAAVFLAEDEQTDALVEQYMQETASFVKKRLDAELVVAIDWRACVTIPLVQNSQMYELNYGQFRRNDLTLLPEPLEDGDVRKQAIPAATIVHHDFSSQGGLDRIKRHMSDAEWRHVEESGARPMIVNVWRPLSTVVNAPLVIADRRTVPKDDVVEVDHVMTDVLIQTHMIYHRHAHEWMWLSHQTPDEVALFPSWIPATNETFADVSPHGAAYLYHPDKTTPPRESVEVRMAVVLKSDNTDGHMVSRGDE